MKTYLFAAGGTGGHVIPAIALAENLRENSKIYFVGTSKGIENRVVPDSNFPLLKIWISGFQRNLIFKNLLFPLKLLVSIFQSLKILLKIKPNVVIGTGGYVCGPVLWCATLLKIPTVLVEENAFPGVTTKLVAHKVTKVCIAFSECKKYLKSTSNVVLTGNPYRKNNAEATKKQALEFFKIEENKKVVFAFGGSQGATSINKALTEILQNVENLPFELIWQTGNRDYKQIFSQFGERVKIFEFVREMNLAYKVADLVICRSGAMTITEITNLGLPTIQIPFPFASENHQEINARTLENEGAGVLISDKELNGKMLLEKIKVLFEQPEILQKMAQNSKKLGNPDATEKIVKIIVELS
ncbi:undecaprenyldiphospho-muramoylpentapeptide beta-N-acetylglucosaminyltransferase [bacterium]|nr:undecaprenyldiphospho-muramoylpentapeptide beta-N-acetylglucosaminyltransferase [bacterium]